MIIFPNCKAIDDVKTAYKWMWHPDVNTIAVSYGKSYHSSIYNTLKKDNKDIPDFYDWIRFIHLTKEDFKEGCFHEPLLCVRAYDNKKIDNDMILEMIKEIGIESKVIFDITNPKLKELTGNYNERY